jgi:hypothetical protein
MVVDLPAWALNAIEICRGFL